MIFLISDLHLDHANIIRYCNRPFKSVHEMNETLVGNWNNTVGDNDTVYYLGDLTFGRGSREIDYWLPKLNGKVIFIKGGHDRPSEKFLDSAILQYDTYKFLLIHKPQDIPYEWHEWVIHGHVHNHPGEFINRQKKMINVSAEMIDYTPISIEQIVMHLCEL